jgi:hypothetical protein
MAGEFSVRNVGGRSLALGHDLVGELAVRSVAQRHPDAGVAGETGGPFLRKTFVLGVVDDDFLLLRHDGRGKKHRGKRAKNGDGNDGLHGWPLKRSFARRTAESSYMILAVNIQAAKKSRCIAFSRNRAGLGRGVDYIALQHFPSRHRQGDPS